MIRIKKMCLRFLLIFEMVAFGYFYYFGKNGIQILRRQQMAVMNLHNNIDVLKKEIEDLEQEIHVWETDDFYKEKFAREQLQMARKGDELFYIGT